MLLSINIQDSTITLGCFDEAAKLHAVAHIGLHFALVVHPIYAKLVDAVGDAEALNEFGALELGMLIINVFNREEHFAHCLQVLFFTRMLCFQILQD